MCGDTMCWSLQNSNYPVTGEQAADINTKVKK